MSNVPHVFPNVVDAHVLVFMVSMQPEGVLSCYHEKRFGGKMMLALPKERYQVVQAAGAQPGRLVHPETHVAYVVHPVARFNRDDADDDSLLTAEAQDALLVKMGLRAGWDEPEMDIYNALDPRRECS